MKGDCTPCKILCIIWIFGIGVLISINAVRYIGFSDAGYITSEENSNSLVYMDKNGLVRNAALFTEENRIVGVFYNFPVEATEGFGTRLTK